MLFGESELKEKISNKLQEIESTEVMVEYNEKDWEVEIGEYSRASQGLEGNNERVQQYFNEESKLFVIKKFNVKVCEGDFSDEILLSSKMKHENVIKFIELLDAMHNSNTYRTYFLVLEHCNLGALMSPGVGKTNRVATPKIKFFKTCRREECYQSDVAKDYMRQALLGLNYLHEEMGYAHLDIKPMNILLKKLKGQVTSKLIDFGNCKKIRDANSDGKELSVVKTGSGTPGFMPLELLEPSAKMCKIDGRKCDVFAMGVTYCIMLTGKLPFKYGGTKTYKEALTDANGTVKVSNKIIKKSAVGDFATKLLRRSPFITLEEDEATTIGQMCARDPSQRPSVLELLNGHFNL